MIPTIEHVQEREGEYYVVNTRVPVGVVIAAWQRATTPQHIVEQFPSLSLADVYGVIILRQKTPPLRAGDEGRPGAPCGRLPAYRRACGTRRLWSGAAPQGSNERVRRSRQGTPVRFAVFGPGLPCLQAWGVVNSMSTFIRPFTSKGVARRAVIAS